MGLMIWRIAKLFAKVTAPDYIPTRNIQIEDCCFATSSPTLVIVTLITAMPVGKKYYFSVTLICISPAIDVNSPFMFLLATHMSSLEKYFELFHIF